MTVKPFAGRPLIEQIDRAADKDRKVAGLDPLARHAAAIKELRERTAQNIIEIGKHLTAARKICGYGNWKPWLEREFGEFGWTDDTALNFMNFYKWYETNPDRVRDLNLPARSLYLLARPSTPEAVREEILDRAERGEPPSHAEVKAAVEGARPKADHPSDKPRQAQEKLPRYAPDEIFNQMDALFNRLAPDDRIRYAVGLFKQFSRSDLNRCARELRTILRGL